VKSQLSLNFDRSSIEQVGAKAEGFQCAPCWHSQEQDRQRRHTRGYLSGVIDFDLENYIALNALAHRFAGYTGIVLCWTKPSITSFETRTRAPAGGALF
jgi:hypothetical protein